MPHLSSLLLSLGLAAAPFTAYGCDAGVFYGQNCTSAKAAAGDVAACNAWPLGAQAESTSTTLIWKKGGPGYGGVDNLGGDVFLSTFLSMGCGGGYYGAQMHWNTMKMSLDWAVWDSGPHAPGVPITHPINPVGKAGQPVDRKGRNCSTNEPPPAGFTQCPCSRYSGEGFGTQCGLSGDDDYLWEIGVPYTLNISLRQHNTSGATFGSTITNEQSGEVINVGMIYTTNPDPAKYHCESMPVNGGSFQEYYDGGNFTNWAQISGPRFKGVKGHVDAAGQPTDVVPTAFGNCAFFGNCSAGGYGGCHNETTVPCLPADGCTSGYNGLPALTFTGGKGTPIAAEFVPPWYNWAPVANADNSAGPDGGVLPIASPGDCDFFPSNYTPGGTVPPHWGAVSGANAMAVANVGAPDANCHIEQTEGKAGPCALMCCAYCKADSKCVQAELANGGNCVIAHANPKAPFGPPEEIKGPMMVVPNRA